MKHLLLTVTLLLTVLSAMAQGVTKAQALKKAQQFLNTTKVLKAKSVGKNGDLQITSLDQYDILEGVDEQETAEEASRQMYFFNVGNNEGFVIVSADERTPEILGYSNEGSLDTGNIPENMRWWLGNMAQEISELQASKNSEKRGIVTATSRVAIDKLLSTKWNQNEPYNAQTPVISGKSCPTGCVATAMAQLLYYLQPEKSTAIPAYTTKTNSLSMDELPERVFNWSSMKASYASTAGAPEVAWLMRYCGQSVRMDYKTSSSSAVSEDAIVAFQKYFGGSQLISQIARESFTREEWNDRIYEELAAQRPVMISGRNTSGHAFICDGYDTDGLFHINWGWGGKSDGYFLLDNLSPDEQGTGGSAGGYNVAVEAIINIHLAQEGEEAPVVLTCTKSSGNTFTESAKKNSEGKFAITVKQAVYNFSLNTDINKFYFTWGVYDESGNRKVTFTTNNLSTIDYNHGVSSTKNLTLNAATYGDGTYYLVPLFRTENVSNWSICEDSELAELKLTFSGDNLTVEKRYPDPVKKFTIDGNITYKGEGFVGAPYTISAYVKNEGTVNSGLFYIIDESNKTLATMALNIDPGETEKVSANVKFSAEGTYKVYIADENKNRLSTAIELTVDPESLNVLKFTQTVDEEKSPFVKDGDYHVINTNTLNIKCTIVNSSSNTSKVDYKSSICFFLYKVEDDSYTSRSEIFSLSNGYQKTISRSFSDLEKDVNYRLSVGYRKDLNSNTYMLNSNSILFRYSDVTDGIMTVNAHKTGDNAIYSIDGRRLNSIPRKGVYIKNGKKYVK